MTTEEKLNHLRLAYKAVMQQYHDIVKINFRNFHKEESFLDCKEETCKESVKVLRAVE